MIPTVEQILSDAAYHCGDVSMKRFTSAHLERAFASAWQEMFDLFREAQVPQVIASTLYTVTAGTISVTPADMGVANFGEVRSMGERPVGATHEFWDVTVLFGTALPTEVTGDRLFCAEWRQGAFHFIGANRDMQIRVRYTLSGDAPKSGSVGIDGCLNFLAYRTAAIAGPPLAMDPRRAAELDMQARGRGGDGRGGFAHGLILDMVRSMQQDPLIAPAYTVGAYY